MKTDELIPIIVAIVALVALRHTGAGAGLVKLLTSAVGAGPRDELDEAARESRAYELARRAIEKARAA
jgi:hypothetical protein